MVIKDFLDKYSFHNHQGFLLSSMLFAIFFIFIFYLDASEFVYINFYHKFYHSYSMIFCVFTPFIIAVNMMLITIEYDQRDFHISFYRKFFYPLLIASIIFLIALFINKIFLIFAMSIILYMQIIFSVFLFKNLFKNSIYDRDALFWIFISFLFGLISNLLYICSLIPFIPMGGFLESFAPEIGIYLFLFPSFMIYAYKFIFDITEMSVEGYDKEFHIDKNLNIVELVFLLSLFHIVLIMTDYSGLLMLSDGLIAILLLEELRKWDFSYLKVENSVWSLYYSLIWIVIAMIISSLVSFFNFMAELPLDMFNKSAMHSLVLGFMGTFYISFGSRMMHKRFYLVFGDTKLNLFITYTYQIFLLIAIVSELGLEYSDDLYKYILTISSWLWVFVFGLWFLRYSHRLYYLKLNHKFYK